MKQAFIHSSLSVEFFYGLTMPVVYDYTDNNSFRNLKPTYSCDEQPYLPGVAKVGRPGSTFFSVTSGSSVPIRFTGIV